MLKIIRGIFKFFTNCSYCIEHSRRNLLIRQRNSRKKRPKEGPETLLEGLDHHIGRGRGHSGENHEFKKPPSVASKALGMVNVEMTDGIKRKL